MRSKCKAILARNVTFPNRHKRCRSWRREWDGKSHMLSSSQGTFPSKTPRPYDSYPAFLLHHSRHFQNGTTMCTYLAFLTVGSGCNRSSVIVFESESVGCCTWHCISLRGFPWDLGYAPPHPMSDSPLRT